MGQQKLLLVFRQKPTLQWVLEAALSSKLDEVICVVGDLKEIEQKVAVKDDKLRWIINDKAQEGQSTSVIAGLKAVSSHNEGALFLVGDQPLVRPELIDSLVDLFRRGASPIVAPTFQGQTRNPVIFHRDLFPDLLKLTGDGGGRELIQKYRDKVALLEWNEEKPFLDVDTWKDYEKLKGL